jgi:predicted Rossmann fold flavoprotein
VDETFDAAILGAGAAGLMCALTAGQRGRRVLLLDHADEPGRKILISGGGRCNFTNLHCAPERFLSDNPHFCRSALARYTQHDFIALVEKHRIPYHEKTLGQLFCDGSAREIVRLLLDECAAGNVDLRTGHRIRDITKPDRFRIETDRGAFAATSVVLATGGLSIPKLGATGLSHVIAKRFGLALTDIRPGLVPLTLAGADLALARPLAGVSLDALVRNGKTAFREALLFTHRGLSGPVILQISSYLGPGEAVEIDLVPGVDAASFLVDRKASRPKAEPKTALGELMPARLADALCSATLPGRPLGETTNRTLEAFGRGLNHWRVVPAGTEGYAKAEVTVGGIDTRSLSSQTMEAASVPGLYAVGEAVDVTGWLGGYNFQWAWSSGRAAGIAV